ncbi:MAG: hypothetical protein IAF02_28760, partial [Anaerolineae bacterium]|nr:hypothetical protein [Anaerolineae bacterium]
TGVQAAAVNWAGAKVPPADVPEMLKPPTWLPALALGLVAFVVILILMKKRQQA